MSEAKIEEKAELKFDKGFEAETTKDAVSLTYKDAEVFENHLPVTKAQAKAYDGYKGKYINEFVTAACEEIKGKMLKNSQLEKGTASAPFGMHKQGSVEVQVVKNYEQRIPNFEDPSKSTTANVSRVTVKVNDMFVKPSKSHVKQVASELTKELVK